MALFSAGFKVDVKAENKITKTEPQDITLANAEWVWTISFDDNAYAQFNDTSQINNDDYTECIYTFSLKNGETLLQTNVLTLRRTKTSGADGYSAKLKKGNNTAEEITVDSNGAGTASFSITKAVVKDIFEEITGSNGYKHWHSNLEYITEVAGYNSDNTRNDNIVIPLPPSPFPDECPNIFIDMYQVNATAYKSDGTQLQSEMSGNGDYVLDGDLSNIEITSPPDTDRYTYQKWTYGVNSTYDNDGLIAFSGETVDSTGIKKSIYGETSFKVWYEEPDRTVYNVSASVYPTGGGTATVNPSSGQHGTPVAITAVSNSGYKFKKWEVLSGGITLEDATQSNTSFEIGNASVTLSAVFESESADISTVMVTKGKDIKLSRFTSPDNLQLSARAKGTYVSVSPSDQTTTAENITVTGSRVTKGVKGISATIDGKSRDVDVVVYDTPRLELNGSSSSKSLFSVDMPEGIFHEMGTDEPIMWEGIDDVVIRYSGKSTKNVAYNMNSDSITVKSFTKIAKEVLDGDAEGTITVTAYPKEPGGDTYDTLVPSNSLKLRVYKIKLDDEGGADYKVNDSSMEDYFYAIEDVDYKISASNKSGYSTQIDKWEGVPFGTKTSDTASFDESKTVKAIFKSSTTAPSNTTSSSQRSSSSSTSTTGRTTASGGNRSGGDDYDDVPKTGESKTDIWILWSVLFVSILGAGFMIWKRFGLVHAIAAAEQEEAAVIEQERIEAEEKEKQDKIDMLKDLRNL